MAHLYVSTLFVGAGVGVMTGVLALLAGLRGGNRRPFFMLAFIALGVPFFEVPMARVYSSTTVAEAFTAYGWALGAVHVFWAAYPWFVAEVTGVRAGRFLTVMSGLFVGLFLVSLPTPQGLVFESVSGLREIHLPWGEVIRQLEGDISTLGWIVNGLLVVAGGYVIVAPIVWLRRKRTVLGAGMLVANAVVVAAVVNDTLVDTLRLQWIYLGELAFAGLVALTATLLVREVLDTALLRRRLAESQAELQAIVDNVAAAVYLKDASGRYLMVNRHFGVQAGCDPRGVVGRTDRDIAPPEVAEAMEAQDREVLEHRAPRQFDHRLAAPGHPERVFLTVKVPLTREDGTVHAVAGITTETTANRLLEDRLRQHAEVEAIGQLAGGIAHDFNNLLMGISSLSEVLSISLGDRPEAAMVDEILGLTRRAADVTSKLFEAGRRHALAKEPVDLHRIIREVEAILRQTLDPRVHIETDLQAQRPTTLGDQGQIQSAILSLALNARDALPEGGVLTVSTRDVNLGPDDCRNIPYPTEPGRYVQVTVNDTGKGIAPEMLPHIFKPFVTTKAMGAGHGMGLVTVWGAAQRHRGAVRVESQLGQGSTFHLLLPTLTVAPSAPAPEP